MKLFKRLFKNKSKVYPYKIIEYDNEDAIIIFSDGNLKYVIDLEWESGVMDIEFGVYGDCSYNTTNLNNQYNVMRTVSYITRTMADKITKKNGIEFHTVTFKSSNIRNGDLDFKSGEIRNKFFARYVVNEFPNAEVTKTNRDVITIKLNRV